jgi:hypothetical protein
MTLAYVQDGETLTIPCPAAGSTIGVWLVEGGILGQALKTTTSGLDLEVYCPRVGTVVRMTKATGFVPVAGEVAFFDFGSDNRLEAFTTAAGVRPVGYYAAAALTGDTAARVIWDPARAQADVEVIQITLAPKANDVIAYAVKSPFAGKAIGASYYTMEAPTSALGAITLVAQNPGVSDNTILNAANFNLETATANAHTAFTLTATAADLVVAKNGILEFIVTSDNADAVVLPVDVWVAIQRTGT